jgi:hypothetical protein
VNSVTAFPRTLWILVQIMLENYSLASSFAQDFGLPTAKSSSDEVLVVSLAHSCAMGKFSAAFEAIRSMAFEDPLLASMVSHVFVAFQTHILSVLANMGAVLPDAQISLSIQWEGTVEDLVVFVGKRGWKLAEGNFTYTPRDDTATKKKYADSRPHVDELMALIGRSGDQQKTVHDTV